MTDNSQTLSLQQVDDLTRPALAVCGAKGRQLDMAVQELIDGLEAFATGQA